MKNFIKLLEKPNVVIPVFLVIMLIAGAIFSRFIGQTPVVTLSSYTNSTASSSSEVSTADLAFPKSGRLSVVSVKVGDAVKKGEVLASLDAGDALGAVNQANGALELAKAQYASLDVQYENAKREQDVLVENAYRTMLSSNLAAVASKINNFDSSMPIDNSQIPQISGTYTCDKTGSYEIEPYQSGVQSGFSFRFNGLESGSGSVTYYNSQPLGSCGLFIQFPFGYSASQIKWIVDIPNEKSPNYNANKNAYELALSTRDQVLKQFEANLGKNGSPEANVAQAAVDSAQGAYEIALAGYRNNLIVAPMDGVVTFVDSHLKVGQVVTANKTVITVTKK